MTHPRPFTTFNTGAIGRGTHRDEATSSWWDGLEREQFADALRVQQERITRSKIGRITGSKVTGVSAE